MLNIRTNRKSIQKALITGLIASTVAISGITSSLASESHSESEEATANHSPAMQKLVRDGIAIEFRVSPDKGDDVVMEGKYANVEFRISDAQSGEPVKGIYPAVWLDISKPWEESDKDDDALCKDRVQLYMQGMVGARPLIDLNSYFVMVMNQNASISVIDPIISVSGMTKLFTVINLLSPGAEWAKTSDEKFMFVSMPAKDKVAMIDLATFEVMTNIEAGNHPVRLSTQPDEKYLWVSNNHREADKSGVSIIDIGKKEKVKFIPTGNGHHELAFSGDSRFAYVSNRTDGTINVIDIASLETVKTIAAGEQVIGMAYSQLSESLYAADGKSGVISVIDAKTHNVKKRINVKTGVGPVGVSQDGRWVIAANSLEDEVYAVDVATNEIAHTIPVERKPYQIAFSRAFVYIRSLGSERVNAFEINQLKSQQTVPVASFQAGPNAPGESRDVSLASAIHEAPGEAAVLVVSPADNTVYYYMEGMNAPMGNFANEGYRPRAVQVADRTLNEKQEGVYQAKVRIPTAGSYDVAFLMETPSLLHCFNMTAEINPALAKGKIASVEFIDNQRKVKIDDDVTVKFRLKDPNTGEFKSNVADVRVRYYRAPAFDRKEVFATEVGEGVYKLETKLSKTGVYYFFVASKSSKLKFGDTNFLTMQVTRPAVTSN